MITNPMQTLVFHLSNSLGEIGVLGETIEEWGNKLSIPAKVIGSMTLMLDELVSNVVMHGYAKADGRIEVRLAIEGDNLVATLRDWAPAFDPFSIKEADTSLAIEDRNIGGLGVHFVRKMADEFSYRRDGDMNEVCLKKRIAAGCD